MKRLVLSALLALASFGALAQTATVPISNLPPAAVPFTGTELFPVVQGGITRKGLLSNLAAFVASSLFEPTNFRTYGTPGSADDTPAFNAFIDACAAGPTKACYMPPGVYNFTSRPNCLHGQIDLYGAGIGPTVLFKNYNELDPTHGLICISSFAANDSSIRNMGIYGKAGTTGGALVSLNQNVGSPIGFLHFRDLNLSTTGSCTTEYIFYMNGTLNSVAPIGIRDIDFSNVTVFGANTYSFYGAGIVGLSFSGGGGVFPAGCGSPGSGDVVFGGTPAVQTTEVMFVAPTIQGQLSFDNTINTTFLTNSLGAVGGTSVTNTATDQTITVMAGSIAGACQANWLTSACVVTNQIAAGIVGPSLGGTGINNGARTLTINTGSVTFDNSGTAGYATWTGGHFGAIAPAATGLTSLTPVGTTSATQVMMGLAGSLTPAVTTRMRISIYGDVFNAGGVGDGATFGIRYGTGSAPANGDAVTGTACGSSPKYISSTTAGKVPFSTNCIATGLSIGTPYWIDLAVSAITGGTATVNEVTLTAAE